MPSSTKCLWILPYAYFSGYAKLTVMQILLLGPAGSGKTSLTATFGKWIRREMDSNVSYVNLDPGCISLPYKPSFDVRSHFTIEEIMSKEKLGPNGAMIRGAELILKKMRAILREVTITQADFRLIDTPGQSEIFVFRPTGPTIVSGFRAIAPTIGVYLIDPHLAETPTSLAAVFSLSMASQLRLGIPMVNVLNKADVVKKKDLDRLIEDHQYLKRQIEKEGAGAITDLAVQYVEATKTLAKSQRLVKVSAKTGRGMRQLYDIIHESLCECGDLD